MASGEDGLLLTTPAKNPPKPLTTPANSSGRTFLAPPTPHAIFSMMSPGGQGSSPCAAASGLSHPLSNTSGGSRHVMLSPSLAATPIKVSVLSTPSRIITISTPVRPCSRRRHKEMQDDIRDAVETQQVQVLRVALNRRHPCTHDHSLHEAIRQSQVAAVRLLLQNNADPNARCLCLDRGCEYPLQLAVSCTSCLRASDRLQAVEMLLSAGAHPCPRRTDQEGNTPLHDAIRTGDLEVVQILLEHAADPNAINGFGEAPLHLALRPTGGDFAPVAGVYAMVETLLIGGASPLDRDGYGLPAAAAGAEPDVIALLGQWAKWWRCRHLAWIKSRGRDDFVSGLMPELLVNVASFL